MPVREYDQNKNYLFPPCLNDWITEDHCARVFSEIVDHIDLSGLCEIKPDGSPRFDPRMMAKVLLWGYAWGVRASRKIEEHLHSDVVFMWLAGRQTPDFRTICDFRRTNRDALERIFAEVVVMARALGMAQLGLVALDGTKIRASAGLNSFKRVKHWREALVEAHQKVAEILAEAEKLDQTEEGKLGHQRSVVALPDELATVERRVAKITALLEYLPKDIDEETRVSSTDPDARFMHTSIGSMPAFTAELAVTADQIIVGSRLTSEPVDNNQLQPGLEQVERICGEKPTRVVADHGFYGGENLKWLETRKIEGYIPECSEKNIGKDLRAHPEFYDKSKFQYDGAQDCYTCPAGEKLKPVAKLTQDGKYSHRESDVYRTEPGTCLKCPLKSKCTNTKQRAGRSVSRGEYDAELTRMRARLGTKEGRATYGKRKVIVEPTIGQLKVVGGMRQFLLRGTTKAWIEFLWSCTAHSVLKITRRVVDGTVKLAWTG